MKKHDFLFSKNLGLKESFFEQNLDIRKVGDQNLIKNLAKGENDREIIEKVDNSISVNETLAFLNKLRTFAQSS